MVDGRDPRIFIQKYENWIYRLNCIALKQLSESDQIPDSIYGSIQTGGDVSVFMELSL